MRSLNGAGPRGRRSNFCSILALLASTIALSACSRGLNEGEASAAPSELTFNRDIAPIVFENCGPCHHAGGSAPFSLLAYENVKKRAEQIAAVTARRYMPPWLPEPDNEPLLGARRLTDAQIDAIQTWVDQGAPEGARADPPAAPEFKAGWQLDEPDLVLEMPEPYTLQASGRDVFRNFVFSIPFEATRYVKAVEILAGNKRVVHHANVFIDRTGTARILDEREPGIGFGGMRLRLESKTFEPQGHFLFWKPGTVPWVDPDEMSWPIGRDTDLVLNMHMKPTGKPETIQPKIGLYFCARPPSRFPMLLKLEHDRALDIPPGEKNFVVTDEYELPVDVEALGIYPHAHYLGREVQGTAILPGGERRPLIWIRDWNLDWQAVYRFERPVHLPKGTTISMTWRYDNSKENVRNPHHPPRRVVAGNESTDEMSHLWVQVLPRQAADREILQEALMRGRLRKDPRDFDAHLSLGSVLQSMGRIEEAMAHYRSAITILPGDATAENNYGAALLITGVTPSNLREAIDHFRRALASQPDYLDARYNLANALLALGATTEAVLHFGKIVEGRPGDAEAHYRLAIVLMSEGKLGDAEAHLRTALGLDPESASVHASLGRLYAIRGDLQRAARHLEQAVRLAPDDAGALTVLGSVYASEGRLAKAIAHLERAVQLDPSSPDARKNLKRARELIGRRQ